MKKSLTFLILLLIIAGVGFFTSAFVVKESEQVVLVQFGEVIRLVDKPGLNFKLPVIQEAKRFDKRWLEWDGDANQITTRDKRYIYIDVFARWRISEPLVFIETLRDEESAQGRLDDIIDNATRNVIANHRLIEVIRSTNREFVTDLDERMLLGGHAQGPTRQAVNAPAVNDRAPQTDEAPPSEAQPSDEESPADAVASEDAKADTPTDATPDAQSPKSRQPEATSSMSHRRDPYAIEMGRDRLTRLVLEKASAKATQLGIELKDVQIKRASYIESVEAKVFDRMISERKRVAEAYRSEGQGRSAEIIGRMEMELQQIQSEAYRESQMIMGRADAKAAEIYADAYEKNPEFYNFTKTMESYTKTVDENNWLILSTDADYVRHLQTMKGKAAE